MRYVIYINTKRITKEAMAALKEYEKRLSSYTKVNLICKAVAKGLPEEAMEKEEGILQMCLLPKKETVSSTDFAKMLNDWNVSGVKELRIYMNYNADGAGIPDRMEEFSLTTQGFSPDLSAVMYYEQLYRAYRILNNQPYHK